MTFQKNTGLYPVAKGDIIGEPHESIDVNKIDVICIYRLVD